MIKSILLGSVAAVALSTSAFAADAIYEAPAEPPAAVEAAPAFSWAGGYIGAQTGYGWGNLDVDGFGSASLDGARLGGFGGYNWQLSSGFLVGLEGDLNYDWNEENAFGADLKAGVNGSARVRAGYAMDRALFFAAGGVAATKLEGTGSGVSADDTLVGWTAGAGVDYAVTNRLFTRVEYRYNDFGNGELAGTGVDLDQHVVNVGVGLKF